MAHSPNNRRRLAALGAAALTLLGTAIGVDFLSPVTADAAVSESLTLDASSRTGVTSTSVLEAGVPYEITISGSYLYQTAGFAGQAPGTFGNARADAECSEMAPDRTYQRNRWALLDPQGDFNDVYVNGQNVDWQAISPDAQGCDPDHVYTFTHTPDSSGRISFKVHEALPVEGALCANDCGNYSDNFGVFTINISDVSAAIDTFMLNTANPVGAQSNVTLDPTKNYRVEVEGTWLPSHKKQGADQGVPLAHIVADAECWSLDGGPFAPSATPSLTDSPNSTFETFDDTGDDYWDVLVNGNFVDWVPADGSQSGCDATNKYLTGVKVNIPQKLVVRAYDSFMNDNTGDLTVTIFEVATPPAAPAPLPQLSLNEEVAVNTADGAGATTSLPLIGGQSYLITVEGAFGWFYGGADAECSFAHLDPSWLENRFISVAPDEDLLDLYVNGNPVNWVATIPNSDGCNLVDHTYKLIYSPPSTGRANFKIRTDAHHLNNGTLRVKIFHIQEIPVGMVRVNTTSEAGSFTPPLLAGNKYRFVAEGTYSWYTGNSGFLADAECARTDNDPYVENFFAGIPGFEDYDDLLDVTINGRTQDWKAVNAASGCDPEHQYEVVMTSPTTGPQTLAVSDSRYVDNADGVVVTIFKRLD